MNELDEARRQLARLAMENQLVKTENRRLRKLAVNRGRGRVLSYALEDAKALLLWRFAGYAVTRRACRDLGMSERRWEWARALLLAARVWDLHANDVDDYYADDINLAVAAVERAADRMASQGDIASMEMRRRRYKVASGGASGVASQWASGMASD